MKRRIKAVLNFPPVSFVADVVSLYFSRRVNRSAAQLAYFLTLTFFPILICVSAFLSRIDFSLIRLLDDAKPLLPEGVELIFRDYLGYLDNNFSNAMLIAGIFLTLLFASAAIRGLVAFMSELFGREPDISLRSIVTSVLFAAFLLFTIYLSLAVLITGNWFFHSIEELVGISDLVARFGFWQWLKYLLLLCIVFLFILLLYRFTAPTRNPYPPIVPGALLASVALAGSSIVFAAVVSSSTRYSLVYGSLASVIIMLVWLYLCGNVLILGNVVNYVIWCRKNKRPI